MTLKLLFVASLFFADTPNGTKTDATDSRCCVCKVHVGGADKSARHVAFHEVDHSTYDALLARFVDCRGQVCYSEWHCDCDARAQLHDYLVLLGAVDAQAKSSKEAELAFYINAYNALAIWGILEEYPTPSIQKHNQMDACYRIFDDLEMWIDDEYLSLNAIENDRLRSLEEPRIHFALVCAAKGCPRLRNEAYTANRVLDQLTDNAIEFLSHRNRFHICRLTGTVYVSPIFKWYRDDFGECGKDLLTILSPYLKCRDRQWVNCHPCSKVKYLGYNWGLNDRCPTAGVWFGRFPYLFYARFDRVIDPLSRAFGIETRSSSGNGGSNANAPPTDAAPKFAPSETIPPPKVLDPGKPKLLEPGSSK